MPRLLTCNANPMSKENTCKKNVSNNSLLGVRHWSFTVNVIPTSLPSKTLVKWCTALFLILACAACTNSRLFLRPMYNSLDDRLEKRFLQYANFNDEQTQNIKELADHFHLWHRQTQLEHYSLLLGEFTTNLKDTKSVDKADIERWNKVLRSYASSIRTCNPFYSAADVVASLSDQQIEQIRTVRQARIDSRRARRDADDRDFEEILDESIDERVKGVRRFLRFINFTLNKNQLDDLRNTMGQTVRPNTSFREVRNALDAEFYTLLDERKNPNFNQLLITYLDKRQQTFSDWRKEARDHNTQIWEAYALRTIHSLDETQREVATNYLSGLASTINTLAADTPSYNKRSASDYACPGSEIGL